MADLGSASSGSRRGGVCLAEHSPQFAATREPLRTTPSSSESTVRDAKSPSDVFAADLSDQTSQLHLGDYQLPQPPKFQSANFTFARNQEQGSFQNAGSAQNPSHFSTRRASIPSEKTAFATPTGRSAVQPNTAGHRSGPLPSAKSSRQFGTATPSIKTPGHHTPGSLNNDIRRIQPDLAPVLEDKKKLMPNLELTKTKKNIAEMAAHCQIDGPLAGPLRESRRSELARNHPAWIPARQVQAGIMTTQQAIRRTPGIPSNIANDLCDGLQTYAQKVNDILRQAVNEVADIKIDLEYNDKILCSNKLESSIIYEERKQLKRDVAEIHRKHEDLEDRLARYHVEQENHKNKVLEFLARLDPRNDEEDEDREQIVAELLQTLKDFMNRPSSRWMHGERETSSKAITTLSTASIAALEKENQPQSAKRFQQPQEARRPHDSESYEIVPSMDNALQPFNYQQNMEQPQRSAPAYAPTQNGPPMSYPGMFGSGRRPGDNRTMSSAGWTRASSVARTQHNAPPSGSYSRTRDVQNGFGGGYQQSNGFAGPNNYRGQIDMPSRPGTAMGHRGSFRPNAPEFHPSMFANADNSSFHNDASYNMNYGPGSNTGSRHDFNGGSALYRSPTPRSASHFGNFEGPSSGFTRPSPLVPSGHQGSQGPQGMGSNHMGYSNDYSMIPQRIRNHAPNSSGNSHHTANFSQQGAFSPGPFGQGGNGPSHAVTSPFAPGNGFGEDEGGDNERYARALESVVILRYMMKLYAPFSEQQAWSYIRQHMHDPMSRACLISRTMIDLLVNRIFTFEAWEGFSVDADRQLREIRHEMNNLPAGQGGALQVCIDRLAAIVNSCINHERYDAYRNHRIEYFQAELREMLSPLLLPESEGGPDLERADEALRQMCEKAWSISAKMFTSRWTFEFRFPDTGVRFNTGTMVGIAPNIGPQLLQAEHWRVQLVVTPVITVRNDTGASISVASITSAHVICMK
ncbi:hypothetical protein CORC01_12078 [Colletotrichum orchidophilum]|uniref:Uncharacterized protein n=1 Tax=Colletotrichum orchidophilum TaxID=1209926 RepID=A0A1G4AU97_9PEZI|nr:uncharacterized protein CORC01_12078 [Colletotrichum orchidophilum]OHE92632.1 hypothetical protein CORC01_12078 [Colletotrichum orchidophilum]